MPDPTATPGPDTTGQRAPGERRLAHPPSDRYRDAPTDITARDSVEHGVSTGRGIAFALIAGVLGSAGITVLGGVFAVSAGLIVVAVATGWGVAIGVRAGAGSAIERSRRIRLALVIAVAAVALGQAGLWVYGRSEGGVLAPLDYLGEVFGVLVPIQFGAGALAAWLAAR